MAVNLLTLFFILAGVLASSFVASLIPGRPIPEVVFFVFFGTLFGPYGLHLIQNTSAISLLSRLGLGFLFLMAGYELNPRELIGKRGRHAALSWAVSLAIALVIIPLLNLGLSTTGTIAFAIALTTTAYGTLVPIINERGITGTHVGEVIESYGAMGELLPVVLMTLTLTPGRSMLINIVVLILFMLICVVITARADRARRVGSALSRFLHENSEAASQPTVRAIVLLMVSLLLLSQFFKLDAVLGAFAAGFILRGIVPKDHSITTRIQTIGNGFFVPVFFVISGITINPAAIMSNPHLLFLYMFLLLVVRGLVMGISLSLFPETRTLSLGEKLSASLYCTMALPLIVALTESAVSSNAMTESMASVLVAAGALTVLVIPLITSATSTLLAAKPIEAIQEVIEHPREAAAVIQEHQAAVRVQRRRFMEERLRERRMGRRFSSTEYLAMPHHMAISGEKGKTAQPFTPKPKTPSEITSEEEK
ncbi:MAG: cation:proton antiporter [Atopobium sp.]|uniref:cation:proton antiporter n=1 Tax=Atopobium sp. TaxID=1872650 RepID=UPI002A760615|nr:cation:proton antiporter [Atopobium sp.]MDY2788485.1 cation:proton antiporter [Atopobium sp.]MDY4523209.1 cation:proton antiporter [Atopobium sp.]